MEIDVFALTLWMWLALKVSGGVIRQPDQRQSDQTCLTYTLNGSRYLDCSDRGLTELPEELDYDVERVVLSNNNFESYPPQLQNFLNIELLDLSGNRLNSPLPQYLQNQNSLFTLNLSNNDYNNWVNHENKYEIRILDLSKNKINYIEDAAFANMPNLQKIDLSENRLADLSPETFSELNNLEVLILSRNYFSEVPRFQSTSLKSLHLGNCQIVTLTKDSFSGMNSLLEIDLSINQIERIPDNIESKALQELILSYNEISSLTDRSFSSLPHLAVLDLRGNNFRDIWSPSHFASNPYLREVHVKGNRWNCEGFSVNLLMLYEFLTRDPPKIMDKASLICYSPSNVSQMDWRDAYIKTWHPVQTSSESFTVAAVMIGVIIGVLITSLVCRCMMSINQPDTPTSNSDASILNLNGNVPQPRAESVVLRVPLREEDLPPSYDEALLMPRLNSFHSLPDFIDEEEEPSRQYRRSRSIGDLTEHRPRFSDRRSVRRTVEIRINEM